MLPINIQQTNVAWTVASIGYDEAFVMNIHELVLSVPWEWSSFDWQVSTQLKQYHDDLLAACLELILALPEEIVVTHLSIVIPALQVNTPLYLYLPLNFYRYIYSLFQH